MDNQNLEFGAETCKKVSAKSALYETLSTSKNGLVVLAVENPTAINSTVVCVWSENRSKAAQAIVVQRSVLSSSLWSSAFFAKRALTGRHQLGALPNLEGLTERVYLSVKSNRESQSAG